MTTPNAPVNGVKGAFEAVKVRIENWHEAGTAAAAAPAKQGYRAHYETFVLTANDPVLCILPEDADRLEAWVLALDNDVVIGTKSQVSAGSNTVTGVPQPIGTYVPKALTAPFPVRDGQAVFAGVTTTSSNSRVSVAAYYRD